MIIEIKSRADVEFLIDEFYKQVVADRTIGYFFTEVIKLDWEKHIPIMCDFWETVIFGTNMYNGNPMLVHKELNKLEPLKREHFDRWLFLWESTVNKNFTGENAAKAILKSKTIAEVMMLRINQSESGRFI